jgi:serine/threonine protein phosphatase PrpC
MTTSVRVGPHLPVVQSKPNAGPRREANFGVNHGSREFREVQWNKDDTSSIADGRLSLREWRHCAIRNRERRTRIIVTKSAVQVGFGSVQGRRPNNEDRCYTDGEHGIFLVADGMGGQESGERASELATEIIPPILLTQLEAGAKAEDAMVLALEEANQAIIQAGKDQPEGRRMGTTIVLAVYHHETIHVTGLGDSRAYLVRGPRIDLCTSDHTVADALVRSGTITRDQASTSPCRHVLYKYLGCPEMTERPEVRSFVPEPGDRLLLATDGLTNHLDKEDLRTGALTHPDPRAWADHLIDLALARDSQDNITCVVIAFPSQE